MPYKPRRTKSLRSLQHDSNKKSPWDSDSEDDGRGTSAPKRRGSRKTSGDAPPIITLPTGYTVRPLRRTDAPAIQAVLNDPDINLYFPESVYPQPFSLWSAHKLIDEINEDDGGCMCEPNVVPDGMGEDARARMVAGVVQRVVSWRRNVDASWDTLAQDAVRAAAARKKAEARNPLRTEPNPEKEAPSNETDKPDSPEQIPTSFGIASPTNDTVVGLIDVCLYYRKPPAPSDDSPIPVEASSTTFIHCAELCYVLGREHRGKGLGSAVIPPFLEWSWRHFAELERINAVVYSSWNPASARLLAKSGFVREGMERGGVWKQGRFGELEYWAMLRPGGQVEERERVNRGNESEGSPELKLPIRS